MQEHSSTPRDLIPDPETVLQQLSRNLREARLLRSLLRLARKATEGSSAPRQEHREEFANASR